jgi:hypothetical protein
MKHIGKSGAALAAAAFTLALTGAVSAPSVSQAADKIMCQGVNACKGQAACKTATNECKGQAACKGQGWISTSAEQCKAWGGKVLG